VEQLRMMRGATADEKAKRLTTFIDNVGLSPDGNANSIDHISHFILRLSYCQTEDLRRWFLTQECFLFQHRLQIALQGGGALSHLLNGLGDDAQQALTPIGPKVKEHMREPLQRLLQILPQASSSSWANTNFYVVPWTQALDLVASKQCLVVAGQAYVPEPLLKSILTAKFRMHLSSTLTQMANVHQGANDPEQARIHPLLKNLNQILTSPEDQQDSSLVAQDFNANTVPQYAKHMPLCMRQLQRGLQQDHKLKHWGRLQYGLFLKGAGLTMDEALLFFQRHFTAVTGEVFQKQYGTMINVHNACWHLRSHLFLLQRTAFATCTDRRASVRSTHHIPAPKLFLVMLRRPRVITTVAPIVTTIRII
jgi:DNA primase large subunit